MVPGEWIFGLKLRLALHIYSLKQFQKLIQLEKPVLFPAEEYVGARIPTKLFLQKFFYSGFPEDLKNIIRNR